MGSIPTLWPDVGFATDGSAMLWSAPYRQVGCPREAKLPFPGIRVDARLRCPGVRASFAHKWLHFHISSREETDICDELNVARYENISLENKCVDHHIATLRSRAESHLLPVREKVARGQVAIPCSRCHRTSAAKGGVLITAPGLAGGGAARCGEACNSS